MTEPQPKQEQPGGITVEQVSAEFTDSYGEMVGHLITQKLELQAHIKQLIAKLQEQEAELAELRPAEPAEGKPAKENKPAK